MVVEKGKVYFSGGAPAVYGMYQGYGFPGIIHIGWMCNFYIFCFVSGRRLCLYERAIR